MNIKSTAGCWRDPFIKQFQWRTKSLLFLSRDLAVWVTNNQQVSPELVFLMRTLITLNKGFGFCPPSLELKLCEHVLLEQTGPNVNMSLELWLKTAVLGSNLEHLPFSVIWVPSYLCWFFPVCWSGTLDTFICLLVWIWAWIHLPCCMVFENLTFISLC